MLSPLQIELTKLIGKWSNLGRHVTDGTLVDFHRWVMSKGLEFKQNSGLILVLKVESTDKNIIISEIPYDSSKDLLDQDESVLKQIVELVKSNP